MNVNWAKEIMKFFDSVGPRNPLKRLHNEDKELLAAMLLCYIYERPWGARDLFAPLEAASSIGAEAGALARRIQSELIEGAAAEVLSPYVDGYKHVAARLESFSKHMASIADNLLGRPGHKGKIARNQLLIMASELVRLRTGKHYDEHLAELLQAVNPSTAVDKDISGEAILKKRKHLMKNYPLIYANLVQKVRIASERNIAGSQT